MGDTNQTLLFQYEQPKVVNIYVTLFCPSVYTILLKECKSFTILYPMT